jgi:hypothetical protein
MAETSYGPDHPEVATHLNNLALLQEERGRLDQAELLYRRALEAFLEFTRSTGYEHPKFSGVMNNYTDLLEKMGYTREQILANRREIGRRFGVPLEEKTSPGKPSK